MSEVAKKPEVLVLGENEAQVIRTKTGEARLFKQNAFLSVQNRGLVSVYGVGNLVTADGYKEMASKSGMFVVNAPTVVVDGQAQQNPHIVKDDKGNIERVYCRSLAFGYTPTGVPAVSDRTVVFDLKLYKLVDLIAKAKQEKYRAAFRLLPADCERPGKTWAAYKVDVETTLWVDTSSSDFIDWMGQMVNRQRKAVEIAQTFSQRNAIKHHPCIKFHKADGDTVATVPLLAWIPVSGDVRWDASSYESTAKRLAEMTGSAPVEGSDAPQVVVGKDDLHEDVQAVHAEAAAGADADDAGLEPPPEAPKETEDQIRARLADQIIVAYPNAKPAKMVVKAFAAVDIDPAVMQGEPDKVKAWLVGYPKEALAALLSLLTASRGGAS